MQRPIPGIVFCLGIAVLGTAGNSQASLFDNARLQEMCVSGQCLLATQDSINQIRSGSVTHDELNSQIGVVAALLFSMSRSADDAMSRDIAQALLFLSQISDDVDQVASLVYISQQILDGGSDLFDLSAPFAVSPS